MASFLFVPPGTGDDTGRAMNGPCPHRPPCPGCPRYMQAGPAAGALAALEEFCSRHGATGPRVVGSRALGSRHRARLMVRGRAASPKVGIFQHDTHRIVDIPACPIHHPVVNEVAAALKEAVRETRTPPYADRPHRGLLRSMQVVVERASGTAQVVITTNDESPDSSMPLLEAVTDGAGATLHSLWWNGQPERSNTLLGPHWHHVSGPTAVVERVPGATVYYPPGAFGQANLHLADHLIAQIHEWVPDGSRIAEFHAGVGAIGLGLVERSAHVSFNEIGAGSLGGLELGIDRLDTAPCARTSVHAGSATDHLALLDDADTVIVDPPRKGLDTEVRNALTAWRGRRLIYASCGIDSFLRDAPALVGDGRWKLAELIAYEAFPFTEHVESLALFVDSPERGD